jgi:hypothetical protein
MSTFYNPAGYLESQGYVIKRTAAQIHAEKLKKEAGRIIPRHRETLAKKVSPHEKKYTYRMGYQLATGLLIPSDNYSRFAGSSFNKKKNVKNKQANKILQEIPFPISAEIDECVRGSANESENTNLFKDPVAESKYHAKLSNAFGKRGIELRVLSQRSRGKVRDKCTAFFRAAKKERIFCTLTFISAVTDKLAVSILNKFLTAVRAESKHFQYIWVAERQTDTKNIHFHLIINRRLPIKRFNALWVLQQYNAGLRYGFITPEEIVSRFHDGTMQQILNPVDVKKIHTINKLSAYLTKYITKGNNGIDSGGFECAVWHCSRGVSRCFISATVGRSAFAATESFLNSYVNKETGEIIFGKCVNHQFYAVRYIVNKSYFLQFMRELETINKWILDGLEIKYEDLPKITHDDFRNYFLNDQN